MNIMHMLLNLCQQNFIAPNVHRSKFRRGESMARVKSLKSSNIFIGHVLDDSSVSAGSTSAS